MSAKDVRGATRPRVTWAKCGRGRCSRRHTEYGVRIECGVRRAKVGMELSRSWPAQASAYGLEKRRLKATLLPRVWQAGAVSERVLLDSRRWPSQSGGDFSELRCLVVDFWQRLKAFDRRPPSLCSASMHVSSIQKSHSSRPLFTHTCRVHLVGSGRWIPALGPCASPKGRHHQATASAAISCISLAPHPTSRSPAASAPAAPAPRQLGSTERRPLSSRRTAQLRTRQLATRKPPSKHGAQLGDARPGRPLAAAASGRDGAVSCA